MKNKIIILIILLFPTMLYSQVKISGQIRDKENNPIDYIEVLLQNKDSVYIKSELTNADGKFTVEADKGEYTVIVRQMGTIYHSQKIELKEDIELGVIQINKKQLSEVVISGQKKIIERKVDRLVFNVENSIASTGGTALDALKTTPRVKVDEYSKIISIIGKGKLGIMIDDKLINLSNSDIFNLLNTIPSNTISKIEVITTPPANYDAEGNAGLINIVLKENKENYWSSNIYTSLIHATYLKNSNNIDFNFSKNKISLSSYINTSNGANNSIKIDDYFYPKQTWNETSDAKNKVNQLSGRILMKYQVNNKLNIGTQIYAYKNNPNTFNNITTRISNNNNNTLDSIILSNNNNFKKSNFFSTNLFSFFNIDTLGKQVKLNFDYFITDAIIDNNLDFKTYINNNLSNQSSEIQTNKNKIKNYSSQIDFTLPYDWAEMEFGSKYGITKTDDINNFFIFENGVPIIVNDESNMFNYTENIFALYFSIYIPISDKFETKLGIRYENTQTNGQTTNNEQIKINYNDFFPTFYFSYIPNDNNIFTIDYSRRIGRPKYSEVNPFKFYSNQYSYIQGNPFIKPMIDNNIEINHIYKDNLSSSLYFDITEKGNSYITLLDEENIIRKTIPQNYYNLFLIGIYENYTLYIKKKFETNFSVDFFWNKMNSQIPEIIPNNEGWSLDFDINNIININKKIKMSIDFGYAFPSTLIDSKNKSVFNCNMAIKYKLFKNKLDLGLNIYDVFKTAIQKYELINNNIKSYHEYHGNSRQIKLSIRYNIGNGKIKSTKNEASNSMESSRL